MSEFEQLLKKKLADATMDLVIAECKRDSVKRINELVLGFKRPPTTTERNYVLGFRGPLTETERNYVLEYIDGYLEGYSEKLIKANSFDQYSLKYLQEGIEKLAVDLRAYATELFFVKAK